MTTIDRSKMTQTDSKGKVTRAPRKDGVDDEGPHNYRWWACDDDKTMAEQIDKTIAFIQQHQKGYYEQLVASTRLYGNSSAYTMSGMATKHAAASPVMSRRVSFNLCASVIDTLVSKIAKNKVVPTFATDGGVWGMQKKAENLSKFVEGMFYGEDVHRKGVQAFKDGGVWGSGLVYVYRDGDDICVERALPHEFAVDSVESQLTDPRQLHRVKIVDRGVAIDLYPEYEKELSEVSAPDYSMLGGGMTAADLIMIKDSYHLPSGKDAEDGRHVISIANCVLFQEEWKKDYYPFPKFDYAKRQTGWWGQGACERLQSLQWEINSLMILDQTSRRMMGSFKVLLENGSKVVSQHLNNDVATIIHYTGTPPQYVTPPAIDPSNEAKLDSLIAKGFQQEGVSQLSASSMKPMGLDSGKALRAYTDIEEDRQLFIGQEMESFFLEIARQMIEVAKDIHKEKGTFEVVFPSTKFIETIDWADIDLKEDEYVLKAFPTSSLKDDIAGRLQDVQDLAQAGMISPRTARKLLRMPDLEMADHLANAAEDLLHKVIEEMIDSEEYTAPEPFWDLTLGNSMALEYYNYCSLQNAPEKVLKLIRRFIAQIGDIQAQAVQAAPQPGAGPGAPPPANPTATPTSPLLPNVNGGQA